jgi:hypothetical protein
VPAGSEPVRGVIRIPGLKRISIRPLPTRPKEEGDDHGKGNEPGDDNGGQTEAAQETPPMNEYGY